MTLWFEGKVALVTGGASGIGRATAQLFARERAKVLVADVDIQGGEETVHVIKEAGGEAIFVKTDVSIPTDVEALVDKAVATYGRLDCAHNNAGIEREYTFPDLRHAEKTWDQVIDINLKGMWLSMKYEVVQMLKQGEGTIVNTSSIAGIVAVAERPAYVASKHGVIGLTKSIALEYATKGIRVNAVCPGFIDTPLMDRIYDKHPDLVGVAAEAVPIGRAGTPEEVAEAVVWLCSDRASFVTGHTMAVDGGYLAK